MPEQIADDTLVVPRLSEEQQSLVDQIYLLLKGRDMQSARQVIFEVLNTLEVKSVIQ